MNARILFALLASALTAFAPDLSAKPQKQNDPNQLAPDDAQGHAAIWAARFLTRFHYKRMALDDAMSAEMLKRYLDSFDSEKLFFLKSDIDSFNAYQDKLDDAIYDGRDGLTPPYDIFRVYVQRVNTRTQHARKLLEKGFDFSVDESISLDRKDVSWASNSSDLDEVWRKRVKNDWLRLKLNGKTEDEIRKTLDKRYRGFADRVREIDSQDIFQAFMNAYASAIEPHTGYLAPRTAENFNIQMKLSLEGIGAVLGRDDEYTVIRTIVKGGPAAQTGKLHIGDRIIGVAQGEKGIMQDVIGWRLDDVVDLIRGAKGTTVVLDVIAADAPEDSKPIHTAIVRDTVQLEEQAAKKSIIEVSIDGRKRKIGVIHLPTFYRDFESNRRGETNARSSTKDVAKLLDELKQKGVEGILIDLRDNGGGSLTEATQLTGLFTGRGPVVQVRDAQGAINIEADSNAKIAWDGPLAVLVNRSSASASEIFAAALQDYGRALIIGQTTYGKGTVQNLVDLDNIAQNTSPQFGQVKLTIAQFFRINGGSTQNKGVVPDIEFPGIIDPNEWGESTNTNALPWTSIAPAKYENKGNFRDLVPLLTTKHETRVAKDQEFKFFIEDVTQAQKLREEKTLSLLESKRKNERDIQQKQREKRKAAREALVKTQTSSDPINKPKDTFELDDGLLANERELNESDTDEENEKPDALLTESAHMLSDAIDFLARDRALAQRVKAFTLSERAVPVN